MQTPTPAEDEEILAGVRQDPEAQPLTEEQLAGMVPMRSLRGRPKVPRKKLLVSIRYSPEVVDYFRATGEGWQARMDGVLKDYVARQPRRQSS